MKDSNQIELDWQRLECFRTQKWPEAVGSAGKLDAGQKWEMQVSICEAGEKGRYFRLLPSPDRTALTSCIKCVLSAVRTNPGAHLIQSLQRMALLLSPL